MPRDDVRPLPFQGAEVEVVLLAGRRVVAFDTVTRRRTPRTPTRSRWSRAWCSSSRRTIRRSHRSLLSGMFGA
jgi:hypothetical protein